MQCFVAPCSVTKCARHPEAVCIDDYCGGCNARFFVGSREVTRRCRNTGMFIARFPAGLCNSIIVFALHAWPAWDELERSVLQLGHVQFNISGDCVQVSIYTDMYNVYPRA